MGKLLKCHLKGNTCMDSILIILKKKWPKGFISPYTGTIFYNIRMYSRSQVSVYRTIGPLVSRNVRVTSQVYSRRSPITSDVAHDVGISTVYRRIYCRKFLTLSNQTSCYILKCIRMVGIAQKMQRTVDTRLHHDIFKLTMKEHNSYSVFE